MTSILGVKKIQYPNGTNAVTVGTDGVLTFDQKIVSASTDSSTFAGPVKAKGIIALEDAGGTGSGDKSAIRISDGTYTSSIGLSLNGNFTITMESGSFFRVKNDSLENLIRIQRSNGEIRAMSEGGTVDVVNLTQGSIKSWASVQQTANPHVIEDSYNVSSVTDNGVGITANSFTNNMNNANYSVTLAQQDGGAYNDAASTHTDNADPYSTSQIGYYCHFATAPNDANTAWCQVAGDLA